MALHLGVAALLAHDWIREALLQPIDPLELPPIELDVALQPEPRIPDDISRGARGGRASGAGLHAAGGTGEVSRINWPKLMAAGLRGLGLTPAAFWALTPVELMLMLGVGGGGGALTRDRLDQLIAAFPDDEKGTE
mgnify:CR=1 FL=1